MTIKHANWPAPQNVFAFTTTRHDGVSRPPYDKNNLALHVGDDSLLVKQNRQRLKEQFQLTQEPIWLEQTHNTHCINADEELNRTADASVSRIAMKPLVILTADCLPITLCSKQGNEIAAIHAGWRGLCNGVIENTLKKMITPPQNLMAWIGPAIRHSCYEVGEEMYTAFTDKYAVSRQAFKPAKENKWLANLPLIAELLITQLGIKSVYQSGLCTFEGKNDFYSYRAEQQTGRIATFIWLTNTSLNRPQDSLL